MRRNIVLDRSSIHSVREPASDVPVYDEVDVLVVGGGPAGVGAALAAARSGMSTLLVERYGCLGGIWTAGLLNPYFDAADKGGIPTEIIDRLHQYGDSDAVQAWHGTTMTANVFSYEAMKYVLDCMAREVGVKLLLYTHAVAAITDHNRVYGVIVENKSGRSALLANTVIDCTGDGDIAYHAGCQYELGRPDDGLLQPMTLMFRVRGFQWPADRHDVLLKFNSPDEIEKIPFARFAAIPVPGEPDAAAIMWTHIHGVDGTNADDLTKAVLDGRRQTHQAMRLLRSAREAFGDGQLVESAMQVGVRETRRILGEYYLTIDDLINGKTFDDGICRVTFNVDIHVPNEKHLEATPVKPYHIPYRCLVPRGLDNLLVAGRCISGSHEAHGSYRVTGNCVAMGQAAGVAAAEAIKQRTDVRTLDGSRVKELMEASGARL